MLSKLILFLGALAATAAHAENLVTLEDCSAKIDQQRFSLENSHFTKSSIMIANLNGTACLGVSSDRVSVPDFRQFQLSRHRPPYKLTPSPIAVSPRRRLRCYLCGPTMDFSPRFHRRERSVTRPVLERSRRPNRSRHQHYVVPMWYHGW